MEELDLGMPQTEDQIPMLAAIAIERAYRQVLASGQNVLIAEAGLLVEVSSDGRRRIIKRLEPNMPVTAGKIITL